MREYKSDAVASVLEGLDLTLIAAFLNAYKDKNEPVWKELVEFTTTELLLAFNSASIPLSRHLAPLPARFLEGSLEQEYGIESIVGSFGNTFDFIKSFFEGKVEVEGDDNAILNLVFYNSISSFYFLAIRIKNEEALQSAFEYYNKLLEPEKEYNEEFLRARFRGSSDKELSLLRQKAELDGFRPLLHRRLSLSIHSWAIFLMSIGKMEESIVVKIIKGIRLSYDSVSQILGDAIYIRKNSYKGYLGVQWWDYKRRKSGVAYTSPSAHDWITLGATYHLLNSPLLDINLREIPENDDYIYLMETVKGNLDYFEREWSKWGEVFSPGFTDMEANAQQRAFENFKAQSRALISMLSRLKNRQQSAKDKAVAEENLSSEKITAFKNAALSLWKKNNRILTFFDYFGNLTRVKDIEKLPAIGRSLYLQGFKMMFLEDNFQEIFGSNQVGGEVARQVDNRFIQELLRASETEDRRYESLDEGLNKSIQSLRDNDFAPSLIIIPPEFIYRTDLYRLDGFTRTEQNDDSLADFGSFNGIPITTFYSPLLSEGVFVLDFSQSVTLEIYEDDKRIENRLWFDIRELSEKDIDARFEQEAGVMRNREDGAELTNEEIRLKIAASVYMDMWINAKFSVKNKAGLRKFSVNNLGDV